MTTVVVAGAVANKPLNGGEAWSRLTLVRGLLELGVDAYLVEELDPVRDASVAHFQNVVAQAGLGDRASLVCGPGEDTEGLTFDQVREIARSADLLINVSGHLQRPALKDSFRRRAFLDLDPGFTQLWQSAGVSGARLEGHEVYFTVGANVGRPGCSIPTCGLDWRPTRPVVLLDDWPMVTGGCERFTTISSWRGPFGPISLNGKTYGLKVHEFRRFIELPQRTGLGFELALDIDPSETADLARLRDHGWGLADPSLVAADLDTYRGYVQGSGAEFGVAQGIYVETSSGWFSDRTVRYLASGKPVLLQDTGLRSLYPTGWGLVPFLTLEQAVRGAASIVADYERHAEAARSLAERYFSAAAVLARLLEDSGVH